MQGGGTDLQAKVQYLSQNILCLSLSLSLALALSLTCLLAGRVGLGLEPLAARPALTRYA